MKPRECAVWVWEDSVKHNSPCFKGEYFWEHPTQMSQGGLWAEYGHLIVVSAVTRLTSAHFSCKQRKEEEEEKKKNSEKQQNQVEPLQTA